MASNSSEIPVMPPNNALGDHEARPEEANPEATGGNECFEGMELAVYYAGKQGNINALSKHRERLHQILTPTRNTVLHIYIACAVSTDPKQVSNSAVIVQKMLEMCPPLLWQSNKIGDTALHIAARYGRTAIVDIIMQVDKKNRDEGGGAWPRIISETNKEGNTALHEAVRFNHFDVVQMLITQDANQRSFYSANVAGETPLYMAAERGYRDLVFQILLSFKDAPYQGPSGRTALHAAVIRNDEEITKELLLEHERVLSKAVDEDGCTPLHLAASLGHTSIVNLLLHHDRSAAYVREKEEKKTALHFAAMKGHVDVMRQLISHCPDCCELVDEKGRNFLHCSIIAGKEVNAVNLILEDPWLSNILLNGKDDNGDTPLHHLADTSRSLRLIGSFETDARVDKMTFNKANQNAFDVLLLQSEGDYYYSSTQGELKDKLRRNGVISGCRIVRNKKEVENTTVKKKLSGDEYSEARDSHLLVCTLIATVSFAAGFTMPGGYQDKGSDQGYATLSRNAAFQAFVVTNTIAMTLSSCSVLLHLHSIGFRKRKVMSEAQIILYMLTMLALIAMVIAFITGTYAVLGHSPRLSTTVCVLGFILFFVLAEFLVYEERGIVQENTTLLPLNILFAVLLWLVMKMFHVIRKLFYQCLRLFCPWPGSKRKQSNLMVASRSSSLPRPEMDRQMIVFNRC